MGIAMGEGFSVAVRAVEAGLTVARVVITGRLIVLGCLFIRLRIYSRIGSAVLATARSHRAHPTWQPLA